LNKRLGKSQDTKYLFIITCGSEEDELREAYFSWREIERGFEALTHVLSSLLEIIFSVFGRGLVRRTAAKVNSRDKYQQGIEIAADRLHVWVVPRILGAVPLSRNSCLVSSSHSGPWNRDKSEVWACHSLGECAAVE